MFQSSPVPRDGCNNYPSYVCNSTHMFQSSPVPRDGCNSLSLLLCQRRRWFQSSPVPRDGCNLYFPKSWNCPPEFQSSPVPRDGCNAQDWRLSTLCCGFNPHPSRGTGATIREGSPPNLTNVSILTRPEGRVQLLWAPSQQGESLFQSSPVPRDGCNAKTPFAAMSPCWFQSSPVPRDGCNYIVV